LLVNELQDTGSGTIRIAEGWAGCSHVFSQNLATIFKRKRQIFANTTPGVSSSVHLHFHCPRTWKSFVSTAKILLRVSYSTV